MSFISSTDLAAIAANPPSIATIYPNYRTMLINDLGPAYTTQSEEHFKLAFAALAAFELKPYGAYSGGDDLASLLAASQLTCTEYCALAWELFLAGWPSSPAVIDVLGFRNGAIGGHAFMQVMTPGYGAVMTVDPTIGVMCAYNNLDQMVRGVQQSTTDVVSFFSFDAAAKSSIASFESQVRNALYNGLITVASFWFQFRDLSAYKLRFSSGWPTPQGVIGP